ncbi:MAG: hypothetical protein MJK12_00440 [Colwellia sp.]|nr:hypothetical protein [Colwellia sp.]
MKYTMRKWYLLIPMMTMMTAALNAQTLDNAKNAYFHRDYQQVKSIIKELKAENAEDRLLMVELALLTIAIDIHNDVDDAGDDLEDFLEINPDNANVHYMAGILWYHHAENVSIFSKMSVLNNHVAALIKAAELEPENERYQYGAASGYGQPSMLGGDKDKQKPIVEKLMVNNSAFAQMAMMDYLQNTQDKENGFIFITEVSIAFKDNIEVLERAAQLLWTFDKKEQAGNLFTAVCLLTPGEFEAFVKWGDACLLSAYFVLDGTVEKEAGLLSIDRLIKYTSVKDEEYRYALSIRDELLAK